MFLARTVAAVIKQHLYSQAHVCKSCLRVHSDIIVPAAFLIGLHKWTHRKVAYISCHRKDG